MGNSNYPTLEEVSQKVWAKSYGRRDYETTLGDLVGGFITVSSVNSPSGELVITPQGFQQLARDRLGLPPAIFQNKSIRNDTKLQILRDLTTNGYGDNVVKVRVAGNQIEAVVSQDYSFFDNGDLCGALIQLQHETMLPERLYVMKYDLSPDGRNLHMRLVAPDVWDFKIGEGNKDAPYFGNFLLDNNELGAGSFKARTAVTRGPCLNTSVGQSLFQVNHKFAGRDDFLKQLGMAASHIANYSNEMAETLRHSQNISIDSPILIFERIAAELHIPAYVMARAHEYWLDQGSGDSLYDVTQAITYGTQAITIAEGRRQPNWSNRTELEQRTWALVEELHNIYTEGSSLEDWYLVGEAGIKERIARYVLGFEQQVPQAPMIADGIRGMVIEQS